MSIKDALLPEFDQEMAVTRRMLERAPESAFSWKPHERSMTLGGLATHLAQIPRWGDSILARESYDFAVDSTGPTVEQKTTAEVLRIFDVHVSQVRRHLLEKSDAELAAPWSLKRNGQVLMTMPRGTAVRRFLLNHAIHHRGQLSVYLRLQNVPLPPIYGPTADES